MDNVDIVSAKDIEASLRERLDWEAITAAREAASEREEVTERSDDETQQLNREDSDSDTDSDKNNPEPEVEEPEVEPSSLDQKNQAEAADADNNAVGEVEDEETSLADEDGNAGASSKEDSGDDEVKASRASRFLRKRG